MKLEELMHFLKNYYILTSLCHAVFSYSSLKNLLSFHYKPGAILGAEGINEVYQNPLFAQSLRSSKRYRKAINEDNV